MRGFRSNPQFINVCIHYNRLITRGNLTIDLSGCLSPS
jgi:hypothetical protein